MIDFDKFAKYSKPGPRYTSYPTAPEFHEGFTHQSYESILATQDKSRKLSLYFHLPFCRSACYFCGCNVVYTSKEDKKERYISYLERELELLSQHLDTSREVIQMHFGGGTPTFFSAHQLKRIIGAIRSHFKNFAKDAEISCEIDPRYLTKEQLDVLICNGFNRVSYGVQDFNDEVQKAIHRIQPYEVTNNVVKMAKSSGIKSINMDLIYGLPYQTFETFQETLRLAVSLDPSRLAVFNYAHVPWMKKSMRKIDETTLPHPSVKLAIMRYTIDYLESNGYKMIGMDHFAKPDDELFLAIEKGELHRNFQGYTTKGGADLIGIGLTSIGEGLKHYVQNFKEMDAYEKAIDAGVLPVHRGLTLNEDDVLRKAVIMEMMSNFKLNIAGIEAQFGIDFFDYFADAVAALAPFEQEELVIVDRVAKKILVNTTGTLLIRNIVMPFDAYLQKIPEDKRRFSKTV
ncbi:oxygen-independent coproporphyrinogen III oxidase [Sulfurospirillum diekertiae]|uniref:Coproporphyrinogen-III oxidase n=1 Tax=Sulfurospirillum diekertiae TaxID=1854492 RepID=A0A1Y0HHT4_9BACT|nr:oxygen-independent coproporphyrinogen III oxidase [Sulfurospirillum diekertiae]ARU47667.1 Oxygen-independent coproporphyrinogen III oxidase [Sulfurospirillum diekertiae]ASC92513.1 Oxygen-independent coproporphyrinogen III oxidase [Sulfurospirillum diekertiae]